MFCRKCGAEIPTESKFCTKCGTKVVAAEDASCTASANTATELTAATSTKAVGAAVAAPSNDAANESSETNLQETETVSEQANLTQAVSSTKNRSRRRVPLIVLVALAFALAAGTAYAAYYVYTEIVVPALEAQQQQAAETEQPTASEESTEEEPVIHEASTSAQNVFQVANLVAMGTTDASSYLSDEGFLHETLQEPSAHVTQFYLRDNTAASYLAGTSAPEFISDLSGIGLGVGYIFNHHALYGASDEYTGSGSMDSALVSFSLDNTPSDDDVSQLLQYCDLGAPAARFSYVDTPVTVPDVDVNGTTFQGYSSQGYGSTDCIAGYTNVNGQRMIWYLLMWSGGYQTSAHLGCCPVDLALELVESNNLFTKDEWNAADDATKADMLAKSMTQEVFSGQNSFCRNVVTGEWRALLDQYEDYATFEEAAIAYEDYFWSSKNTQ